jgi:hypothetical protein
MRPLCLSIDGIARREIQSFKIAQKFPKINMIYFFTNVSLIHYFLAKYFTLDTYSHCFHK